MFRFSGPVQADPPLGTTTDPQPQPQTHPRQQHRSNLLAQTEGGPYGRETKLCLHPSSDETLPLRIPAETPDGRDVLFGNVHLHGCHVAHLHAHANAHAERFVRSIKESCLDRMILFGERSLKTAIRNFVAHYHSERNHQGLANRIILPETSHLGASGSVQKRATGRPVELLLSNGGLKALVDLCM